MRLFNLPPGAPLIERYRYWRGFDLTASTALAYVREEDRMRAIQGRLDWRDVNGPYDTFARADFTDIETPYTVRVSIGYEDEPTDWGDCEPTDEEREHASSFYVSIQVLDGDAELYRDVIGGVDVIDLPGYLQRDWEDAAAYALLEYLLPGAERFATMEAGERAHWAARGLETVA